MKMNLKKHLINKKASLFILLAFTLVSCEKSNKTTDVGNLVVDSNETKENNNKNLENEENLGIKERKKDNSDKKDPNEKPKEEVFKISEHMEDICQNLKNLHHFSSNRTSILNNNIENLKKLNCEIKSNLNKFIYQEKDSIVMASIVKNSEIKQLDKTTYQFNLTISCGESVTNGLNRDQVGLNLIEYLKDNKYNKNISYIIKLNNEDTKADIILNNLDWYEK